MNEPSFRGQSCHFSDEKQSYERQSVDRKAQLLIQPLKKGLNEWVNRSLKLYSVGTDVILQFLLYSTYCTNTIFMNK